MEDLANTVIYLFDKLGYVIDESRLQDFKHIENRFELMSDKEILQVIKKGSMVEKKASSFEIIKLINYKNILENKFELITSNIGNSVSRLKLLDGIIAINGIPIAMIEIKQKVENACFTLQSYLSTQHLKEELKTIQLMIAIGKDGIKFKARNAEATWNKWRMCQFDNLEENVKTIFNKEHFLNLIRNFTFYINGKNATPRYYQYEAVEAVMESNKKQNKIYIPTGAGKTTTMLLLVEKMKNENENAKIVIVTERLFQQDMLRKRIVNELSKEVVIANNVADLENIINSLKTEIIITTIQKLLLYTSKYLGEIKIITDLVSEYYEKNVEIIQRTYFPNSVLIQFTNFKRKSENYEFCYSENQAIMDGIIVPVFYEKRENVDGLNVESITESIELNSTNRYLKDEKIIIITKEKNVIEYINKIKEKKLIATSTILENVKDEEDIIRENGNLLNYTIESMREFNYGKLEILVVTNLEELRDITTSEVNTVYLDKEISVSMISEILKIISKKSQGKERSFIIDYAYNYQKIGEYLSEDKNKEEELFVSKISRLINDTRQQYCQLTESEKNIKNKLENLKILDDRILKEEIKEYQSNLINFLELINLIYSSDELLKMLEEDEKVRFKENTLNFIKLLDNLAVIYAEEVEEQKLIQKYCMKLDIEFSFTPISKDDLEKYPNLDGAWKRLNAEQTAEAIKNNLKLFAVDGEKIKKDLDILTVCYKNNRITKDEYYKKIEQYRKQYVEKSKEDNIPKILKDNQFAILIYYKMQNLLNEGKIRIITHLKLEEIILKIEKIIKSNIKIEWKNNIYLYRKIELKIIEEIYNHLDIEEKSLNNLLKDIKEIAFETINIQIDIDENKIYYIKKKNAYAVGKKVGKEFYVFKNSTTVDGLSKSLTSCFVEIANKLREDKIIVNNKFVKDYKFNSQSTAAVIILGRNANGRLEWKDKAGRTIAQNEEE